ncbi:MAG: tetraacyldisaccharide 4'-kinase [Taibaiella sp.]|nr:tetraacyldisaccharide 4'-kinase [Taibaiella sp.]
MLKFLLYPFAVLYGMIMWLRNRLYDTGFYSSIQFSIPVICVGNLSTGGTGKTPHIEYLVRLLRYEYNIGTQSRGYKRRSRGFKLAGSSSTAFDLGDEPMQFHLKFPEIAVSVCEERMTGIPSLLAVRPEIDVVLLDDAFQHRSVKAGLNILITDYAQPFYNDYILPFGNLREQRSAAKRAHIIIVSKCPEDLDREAQQKMIREIQPSPEQQVYFTKIRYGKCYNFFTGQEEVLHKAQDIVLVSGIAKPEPMQRYIEERVGAVHLLKYPDHHYFTAANLDEIRQTCSNWKDKRPVIVTTEKDATRLALKRDLLKEWQIDIWVLPIEIAFLNKEGEAFDSRVRQYLLNARGMDTVEEFEEIL